MILHYSHFHGAWKIKNLLRYKFILCKVSYVNNFYAGMNAGP